MTRDERAFAISGMMDDIALRLLRIKAAHLELEKERARAPNEHAQLVMGVKRLRELGEEYIAAGSKMMKTADFIEPILEGLSE